MDGGVVGFLGGEGQVEVEKEFEDVGGGGNVVGFADGAAQGFLVSMKPKLPQGRLILESLCIHRKVGK